MKNTVLIADDNKTMVMYLEIILKRMGFETVKARDGYEAVRLMDVCRPDILITDSGLPQFDALQALREFAGDADGYAPSVIMLVGMNDGNVEERSEMLGACVRLTKPVDTGRLHEAIQDCRFKPLGTKRTHMRTRVEMKLIVNGPGGEREVTATTLSAGGAFIAVDDPPAVGETLDIFLPCSDEQCLFVTGRVIYTNNCGPGPVPNSSVPGFAVEFIDLSEDDRMAIDGFVGEVVTEGALREATDATNLFGSEVYSALRSYASATRKK